MNFNSIPETIRTIIDQSGGLGLRGAFVYIGASGFAYRCAQAVGEYRSGRPSRLFTDDGGGNVDFEVGLKFRVNGKRGRDWAMVVAYEPDDTYSVWLVEGHADRTADSMVLACHRDVYCDTLKATIERTYDEAIRKHNQGFIPLE